MAPPELANRSANASIAPATENMASVPDRPFPERLVDLPFVCRHFAALVGGNGVISTAERFRPLGFSGVSLLSLNIMIHNILLVKKKDTYFIGGATLVIGC